MLAPNNDTTGGMTNGVLSVTVMLTALLRQMLLGVQWLEQYYVLCNYHSN